jgi:hypothetical protein
MRPTALLTALATVSLAVLLTLPATAQDNSPSAAPVPLRVELLAAHKGFDGTSCWVHARAGAIPPGQPGNDGPAPLVVMTMQKLLLSGSDVFYALNDLRSTDAGLTWTPPVEQAVFARETMPAASAPATPLPTGAEVAPHLLQAGDETTVCDFTPQWHAGSRALLGTGQTVWYRDNKVLAVRPRSVAYAVYDAPGRSWNAWKTLPLPDEPQYQNAGAGSGQRCDLENGEILLGVYHAVPGGKPYCTTVFRCRFDGRELRAVEHGPPLTVNIKRGLYEPSLTQCGGRFYLTLRNDDRGYVAVSEDGLRYGEPRPWRYDDGAEIGNYNTQQHWLTLGEELYLVYTRRGAGNDHVFRHRAPLFLAQVDRMRLCLIRETERVLIPQRGAGLGNFGVCQISPTESWVIASEWMQPKGSEKHGSDNSVWIAKVARR